MILSFLIYALMVAVGAVLINWVLQAINTVLSAPLGPLIKVAVAVVAIYLIGKQALPLLHAYL